MLNSFIMKLFQLFHYEIIIGNTPDTIFKEILNYQSSVSYK